MTPEQLLKQCKRVFYMREYNKNPILKEKTKIRMQEHRKKAGVMEYQREYQRKRRAELALDPMYVEKMKKYNHEYGQKPEVKARRKLINHDKWLKHRMQKDGDNSGVKRYPNYKYEAGCRGCKRVFLKPIIRCPICHYMLKQGPRRKKDDVFRY